MKRQMIIKVTGIDHLVTTSVHPIAVETYHTIIAMLQCILLMKILRWWLLYSKNLKMTNVSRNYPHVTLNINNTFNGSPIAARMFQSKPLISNCCSHYTAKSWDHQHL